MAAKSYHTINNKSDLESDPFLGERNTVTVEETPSGFKVWRYISIFSVLAIVVLGEKKYSLCIYISPSCLNYYHCRYFYNNNNYCFWLWSFLYLCSKLLVAVSTTTYGNNNEGKKDLSSSSSSSKNSPMTQMLTTGRVPFKLLDEDTKSALFTDFVSKYEKKVLFYGQY